MKKKKYYNLMAEYKKLAEQKYINDVFFNQQQFDSIKTTLCEELNKVLVINDGFSTERSKIYFETEYQKKRICYLLDKINLGECISKEDYQHTHLEELYDGLFASPHYSLIFISIIVVIIYIFFIL